MSTVLSADLRELLAFLLALERLQATSKLTDNEMLLWMGDTATEKLQLSVHPLNDVGPHWLSYEVLLCIFTVYFVANLLACYIAFSTYIHTTVLSLFHRQRGSDCTVLMATGLVNGEW